MGMRYGHGATGRTAGREAGREAGRRGDGTTSETGNGERDGAEIVYSNDEKNVLNF